MIEATADGGAFVTSGNRWDLLPVASIGAFEASLSVSVVIPNRDEPLLEDVVELLVDQSLPDALVEIIVVDDGSDEPLDPSRLSARAARRVRIIENPTSGFGAGAARRAGAAVARNEVLVFVDADMRVPYQFLEAHTRWHHVAPNAVVVGEVRMLEAEEVASARLRQEPEVAWRPVTWISRFLEKTDQLRDDHRDVWSVTAGANLSLRRSFYERCGGFSGLGIRGIEDIEFGYRAYAHGALVVPEKHAHGWHPRERFFDDPARGAAAKARRSELLADLVPTTKTRPSASRRIRTVPDAVVHVQVPSTRAGDATWVLREVDSFLDDGRPTAELVLHGLQGSPALPIIQDGIAADPRVRVGAPSRRESALALQIAFCSLDDLPLARRLLAEQRGSSEVLGVTHADRAPTVVLPGRALARACMAIGDDAVDLPPPSEALLLAQRLFGGDWRDGSEPADLLPRPAYSSQSTDDSERASKQEARIHELEAMLERLRGEHQRLRSRRVVQLTNRVGSLKTRFTRLVRRDA